VRSDTERVRSLEILDQEARRLAHLVDNMLYVARGERGAPKLTLEAADLGALARDTIEGFAPLAAARRVTIASDLVSGVRVKVDPGAVRQILLNLLDNAVKYGPAGETITVSVGWDGDRARILVDDRGPGIPVDARRRIWERFARLDRDVQTAVAGSGIGLAIVAELVTSMGGLYHVQDAPGGGSRFVVEIPA
jgi:signal transduction histidine kinase